MSATATPLNPTAIDRAAILARWTAQAAACRRERAVRGHPLRPEMVRLRDAGFTYRQIAATVGLSATAVWNQVQAARRAGGEHG